MRRWTSCLATAVRFALIEQLRNRLALVIVVFFIPLWITLGYKVTASDPVRFFVRPVKRSITMDGNVISQMSGALHALGLIVGFMMFIATARSASFDRRLVLAGYPRLCLALAKFTALVLAAAVVAVYGAAWMRVYWRPQQLLLLAVGLFVGALIYGGIGVMLAAGLRSELAGMFLVIMISFIDLSLQNPIANPAADSPLLRFFPAYGAMQTVVTAGGLHVVPWHELALGILWAMGMVGAGMTAFGLRSRSRLADNTTTAPAGERHDCSPALAASRSGTSPSPQHGDQH
ncbi:ABC transporter permease [Streptomyces sp. NBC_00576]|uniref:ABC transporter permease n=1 Tax=Streptomyces sp. NBC_00576 TaxID=2903665 RepID=UPI002E804D9C|nr:ABC transporter permease [Streptomyces sp. NBC_00576]WUB69559.1 ABC transporter permease [Streptomyces sp. NBC_00576]